MNPQTPKPERLSAIEFAIAYMEGGIVSAEQETEMRGHITELRLFAGTPATEPAAAGSGWAVREGLDPAAAMHANGFLPVDWNDQMRDRVWRAILAYINHPTGQRNPSAAAAAGETGPSGEWSCSLTEQEGAALSNAIGDEEAAEITIFIGDGHSGYGLYVCLTEYPDHGATLITRVAGRAPKRNPPAAQPLPSGSDASGLLADYVFHSAAMADLEQATGTKDRGAHPDCGACHGAGRIGIPGKPCNFCVACWIADEFAKLKAKEQPLPAGGVDESDTFDKWWTDGEQLEVARSGNGLVDEYSAAKSAWLARSRLSRGEGREAK